MRGIRVSSHRLVHLYLMATRLRRRLEMSLLLSGRRDVILLRNLALLRGGLSLYSAPAPIITDPIGIIPNDAPIHVSIVDVGAVDIIGCRVVGEMSALPATAAVTMSPVTVAIINATVISD